MTRWLVTGARGQLGSDLLRALDGHDVTGLGRADLDICDREAVRRALEGFDVVINAAAYTNVDEAERDSSTADQVNHVGPSVLADACVDTGALLVQVSTDYVFDGTATVPYSEDAPTSPLNAYGRTKAAGECAVLSSGARAYVVRTSWLYGETGRNFVKTMIRLEATGDAVSVVDDQHGSPTWSGHLAPGLVELARSGAPSGIYHFTNAGSATWFQFARAIFEELGADPDRVKPISTADFPRPAPRPAYSVLAADRWLAAGLTKPAHWRDALQESFGRVAADLTQAKGRRG
jgi:dTDP-4-dehydrorhamnose reductase